MWAPGLASLTISRGRRRANESRRLPAVVGAIRFLAKPGRGRRAIRRKAEVLRAAWNETSIRRITEIVAAVAPFLSIPRGRKISAASAAHEFLLDEAPSVMHVHGDTWDPSRTISPTR